MTPADRTSRGRLAAQKRHHPRSEQTQTLAAEYATDSLARHIARVVTGLGERTAKNSLRRLVQGRHLLVAVKGKAGEGTSRRATIYRLPDVPVPEDGSMGPPLLSSMGPPC